MESTLSNFQHHFTPVIANVPQASKYDFQSVKKTDARDNDRRRNVEVQANEEASPRENQIPIESSSFDKQQGHQVSPGVPIINPFSTSPLIKSKYAKIWFYIDESNNVQGPYASLQMDRWLADGYFFDELLISSESAHGGFTTLMSFILRSEELKKEQKKSTSHKSRQLPVKIQPILEVVEGEDSSPEDGDEDLAINTATGTDEPSENGDKDRSPVLNFPKGAILNVDTDLLVNDKISYE